MSKESKSPTGEIRACSYGGGKQSFAMLILAAQGKIDCTRFVFANVGEDSESPEALRHVQEVAKPYAEAHGFEFVEVRRTGNHGWSVKEATLYHDTMIPIPVRSPETGAPMHRLCTRHWKSDPIAKYLRSIGARKNNPATLLLGISIDEWQRVNYNTHHNHVRHEYPLIDLQLSRQDCVNIIKAAGLPVPPKSACYFCPFTKPSDWHRMKQEHPDLFMNAVVFEQDIIAKRRNRGKPPVYLSRLKAPLYEAIGDQSLLPLDDDDTCESGYCMT